LQPQRDIPLRSVWDENPRLLVPCEENAAAWDATAKVDEDSDHVESPSVQAEDHYMPAVSIETNAPPAAAMPPALLRKAPRRRHQANMLPTLDLLDDAGPAQRDQNPEELKTQAQFLEQKLRDFGVEGEVVQVLPGPVITMYEFAPAPGIKVSKIANLQDDLALVMRALSVRVVAPIPGKAVVGIEIPNKRRDTVRLRELLDSEVFQTSSSKLTLALGKDILGKPVVTDLALIPHLLIAGATGSGKSVGLNSMICSLLFRATPADVKMIMIDPKMLELSIYDGIPHLLVPVVMHPKKAAVALRRVVEEMERRYQLLASKGVRSIAQYNQSIEERAAAKGSSAEADDTSAPLSLPAEKLPYLVVVIDELSDLMMVSSREVEDSLTRIAQMARAAGIHLIVATQRPSVDVLTGVIKANFPARVSFQVSSKTDSRTILDANGAEKLLGRGDMLFLAPGTSKSQRIHGAYVSEAEINRLVAAWKDLEQPHYDDSFLVLSSDQDDPEEAEYDEKYDEAVALVARTGQASISMLQRRLRVGYNRAARMIETMEREGVVGPADGIKPREVLVRKDFDEV
jgi:DNA segregation ATPase FtsK/SpoIIIE, S-DNA-T family